VEDYHSEDLVKAEVLDAINEFGVQTPLFGQKAEGARHNAFVLVEGVQDAEGRTKHIWKQLRTVLTVAYSNATSTARLHLLRPLSRSRRHSEPWPLD